MLIIRDILQSHGQASLRLQRLVYNWAYTAMKYKLYLIGAVLQ
jgi:hypothetical protein